jgi:nitrogen regulatory protein PII
MRLVVAVLRPAQLEIVRGALARVQVTRMTICDAQGYEEPSSPGMLVQQALVEIAVNDDFLERTVEAIAAAIAGSGENPAERIMVLPLDEALQIYREVRGQEAI